MPHLPILLFPSHVNANRSHKNGGFNSSIRPTPERQGQRLSPVFLQLQHDFDERNLQLQQTAAGVDPEQVLVIETIGSVEDFSKAVKRVDGFEWLGEIEVDDIAPDDDFYDPTDPAKPLNGRLYLVMSNQRALTEMLSLWNRYIQDQQIVFERGFARFREVFLLLKDIRRWSIADRLYETGLLEAWREDLPLRGTEPIRFEVELWYRDNDNTALAAASHVTNLIQQLSGRVISECRIPEISYHSLLAQIPPEVSENILQQPDVDLIKCESVMFFHPVGQMATGKQPFDVEYYDIEQREVVPPVGPPIVALLDGLPLENHFLLRNHVMIDDPDDISSTYNVRERIHGTSMASLLIHGDLSDNGQPINHPLYVRPIMKPFPGGMSSSNEYIPDDILVVDFIHRAMHRIFEHEGTTMPVAPTVKLVNFSIGDPCRQFINSMSPLARLLDWLTNKYQVLFIVSAGNHTDNIRMNIPRDVFDALDQNAKERCVIQALYSNVRNRRILSPAEGINVLTVGALHEDSSGLTQNGYLVDLFQNRLPSPISAFGGGYKKSIKPEMLFSGGRTLFLDTASTPQSKEFAIMSNLLPPGNKVAAPSLIPGEINKTTFCRGTSNSAALVTRIGAECHDLLKSVFEEQAPGTEYDKFMVPLIKTLLVHGCTWGDIGSQLHQILYSAENCHKVRNWISWWLGYGSLSKDRIISCTDQRVTLLGYGQLLDEEAHLYDLPLPQTLSGRLEWRRVIVTLGWSSPILANSQRYRVAHLWHEIAYRPFTSNRTNADRLTVQRGTIQHEVFEGDNAIPISEDDILQIKINCRKDACKFTSPIPYGLAVTLEVSEALDISVYNEIQTRIMPAIEIRQ